MLIHKSSIVVLLFASLSMFGLTAVATTPDGETPPNEHVCDGLIGSTPGLYGLCVAFCEAQDCEVTYDPATQEMTFAADCRPSSPKLLDNFNKRAGPGGPTMPCINIVENECPCWTEAELAGIAETETKACNTDPLFGSGQISGYYGNQMVNQEGVLVQTDQDGNPNCIYDSKTPLELRNLIITEEERTTCLASIAAECVSRGFEP